MDIESFYFTASNATEKAFFNVKDTIFRQVCIGGINLQLKFAGEALMPLIMPAISHLLISSEIIDSEYMIEIWDSESTNSDFPEAPCAIDDIQLRGEIKGLKSNRYETAFFTHAHMLTLLDHDQKKGIICFADNKNIPAFELACPLRGLLSWILRRNNIIMLHAAAVGTADGCILIGGNSGAGKSSTALRCLVGGLNYLGDDISAISIKNRIPEVYSIYSSGKSLSKDLPIFPQLFKSLHSHHEEEYEKEIFFFNTAFDSQLKERGRLLAVIIPHQNPLLEIGFESLSIATALSVIGSSTKLLLPDAGNEVFHALSTVLHSIPCFQFNLGSNPEKIASTLKQFIANLKIKNDIDEAGI
jgi:hypothetical protein